MDARGPQEMTGKRYERSTGGLALAFAAALIVAACQSTPPIPTLKTRTLMLHCDREYNDGYLLPVDLVFIPNGEDMNTITEIGPDDWFDSDKRDQWAFRQSVSLLPGERRTVAVDLRRPAQPVAMVIFANFINLGSPKGQMVVFDTGAAETENVFVTVDGLLH
jgi:predicted component of type VI protein secretion system